MSRWPWSREPVAGRHWRNDAALRRDVRALLRRLRIGAPLDVAVLCDRLGEDRGHEIHLHAADLPASVSGLWMKRELKPDLILYQRLTTPAHQEHIILHEVGHVIAGHGGVDPTALLRAEQAAAAGEERELHLGYGSAVEREAEMVATVVRQWCLLLENLAVRVDSDADHADRRLRSAFDDRQAWL